MSLQQANTEFRGPSLATVLKPEDAVGDREATIDSTSDVLDRHLKCFRESDLDGILADYSSDAVLFLPAGPLKGPAAIRPLFQALISEFAKPDFSLVIEQGCVVGDYAYILWTAETADNNYEIATDTFVVRNGKIVAQSFAAKIQPKH